MNFDARTALCGAAFSAAVAFGTTPTEAGGWFRKSPSVCESCTAAAPVACEGSCKTRSFNPAAGLAAPPIGPVVTSMPILTVPVTAVAMPTQAVNITAVTSSQNNVTAAERIKLLKELAAAMDAPAGTVTGATPTGATATDVADLREQVRLLREQLGGLHEALKNLPH